MATPNGRTDGLPRRDADGNEIFQRSAIWLDEDYLLGPEAGHANWTGQSGLATKTSHALFLTSAVFQELAREDKTVAALMFNVKGPDLIWLDKPAIPDESLSDAFARADVAGLPDLDIEAYAALRSGNQTIRQLPAVCTIQTGSGSDWNLERSGSFPGEY